MKGTLTLDGDDFDTWCSDAECHSLCSTGSFVVLRIDDCLDSLIDFSRPGTDTERTAIKNCYNTANICSDCFSGDTTVQIFGQDEPILMKHLQVGDQILIGDNKYESVYAFAHKDDETLGSYLAISTDSANNKIPLEIAADHLLFVQGHKYPIRADQISIGDELISETKQESPIKVTDIQLISKSGVYNPLTPSGTIVVNGLKASTYLGLQRLAPSYVEILEYIGLSHHMMNHLWFSPLRVICTGITPNVCEQYTKDGIHSWSKFGMTLANTTESLHWALRPFFMMAILLTLTMSIVVEYIATSWLGSTFLTVIFMGIVAFAKQRAHVMRKTKTA